MLIARTRATIALLEKETSQFIPPQPLHNWQRSIQEQHCFLIFLERYRLQNCLIYSYFQIASSISDPHLILINSK